MKIQLLAPVLVLALLPPSALAHSGAPFGTFPFLDDDGVLYGGGTDYGMVLLNEAGVPEWTCEEAFEFEPNWWYSVPGQPVVAGTFSGLFRSSDGGCIWVQETEEPLASSNISAHGFDPLDAAHVWIATGDAASTNRIYESTNGGVTFEETGWSEFGIKPRGIAVVEGGQTLLVLSIREEDAAGLVQRSDDRGATWSDPVPLTGWAIPTLLGLSEAQDSILIGVLSSVPADGFALLELDISLATPAVARQNFDSPPSAFGELDGTRHLAVGYSRYWRKDAGAEAYVEQGAGPIKCFRRRGDTLIGCGLHPVFPQFASLASGETEWVPLLEFSDIVPRECPVGSLGAELCPEIWTIVQELAGGGDDDDATDDDDAADDDDASSDDDDAADDDDVTTDDDDSGGGAGTCADCANSLGGQRGTAATGLGLIVLGIAGRRRRPSAATARSSSSPS